jgi:drug/metabolite transporter (DMT)-like permease
MSRRGWLLFAAMSFIWGIPYLLIKVAVADLNPVTLVFARTAIGAFLLVPVAARQDSLRPLLRHWRVILITPWSSWPCPGGCCRMPSAGSPAR